MNEITILSAADVARLLSMPNVIESNKGVYAAKSAGRVDVWPTIFKVFEEGKADMDIKSGWLKDRHLFGHKTVSWFGGNAKYGLPTLNGTIMVFDDRTGMPLGIVEGSYVTCLRTGAAGAIGAYYLAQPNSRNLLVIGAGNQAGFLIAATLVLFPDLKHVGVYALDRGQVERFVADLPTRMSETFGIDASRVTFEAVDDLEAAVGAADIIHTATPSRVPIVKRAWVRPGTHFSCIGADAEGKQELESSILADAIVYVDDREHCLKAGEVEVPIKEGVIAAEDIAGEIGDLVLGEAEGRTDPDQITVFDATGMALLDIACASTALEAAAQPFANPPVRVKLSGA